VAGERAKVAAAIYDESGRCHDACSQARSRPEDARSISIMVWREDSAAEFKV
jgi:hypothetical protein